MFSVNQTLGYQAPLDVNNLSDEQTAIAIEGLNLFYQNSQALSDISMRIPKGK
ncbi:phosphate transport ATP-binding protein PstB [Vibrio ponticus]|nr:phosphate transport ATP-binding protein PstB [Vibrio ponticus]